MDDRLDRLAEALVDHLRHKADHFTILRRKNIEKWFQIESFYVASRLPGLGSPQFESNYVDLIVGGAEGPLEIELKAIGDQSMVEVDLIKSGLNHERKTARAFVILTWGLAMRVVQMLLDEWCAQKPGRPYRLHHGQGGWGIFVVPPAAADRQAT